MIFSKTKSKAINHYKDTLEKMNLCLTKYLQTGDKNYLEIAKKFGRLSQDIRTFVQQDDFTRLDEGERTVETLSDPQN